MLGKTCFMGIRQELVIQRLDQTFAGNLQVGFLAYLRADVGFAQPNAFCKVASPALEDRNAPDPLAEPCRSLAEDRPIQLVQEMPHVLCGGGIGQPLRD